MLDEKTAEQRPDDRREPIDAAEHPLITRAAVGRDEVADRSHRDDHQPAAAEALQRAQRDQLRHVLRDPAERRSREEQRDRDLQHDLAAVQIAELAVERQHDGRR